MEVTKTIASLSAMITPAVLIMATGSLILATSQRLGRVMERARKVNDDFRKLDQKIPATSLESSLYHIMTLSLRRAKYLQRTLSNLYICLSLFIATSATIGIIDMTHSGKVWLPLLFGVSGITLLLYCSLLLIRESRIALNSVFKESELMLSMNKKFMSQENTFSQERINLLRWIRRSHSGNLNEKQESPSHRS